MQVAGIEGLWLFIKFLHINCKLISYNLTAIYDSTFAHLSYTKTMGWANEAVSRKNMKGCLSLSANILMEAIEYNGRINSYLAK